jgi:hypothetical protein
MKLLKEILKRDTISEWRIPSKSNPGEYHIVRLLIDGSFTCDCVAAQFRNECRHIKIVKKWQKKL